MKWEFSSMFTVSLMLILIPLTGAFEESVFENPWFNLFPGLTFLAVGFIGGYLTNSEYKKAIIMVAASYVVIGLFAALNISISCAEAGSEECFYINLTLLGIPTGVLLTSLGIILGYKLKEYRLDTHPSESNESSEQ